MDKIKEWNKLLITTYAFVTYMNIHTIFYCPWYWHFNKTYYSIVTFLADSIHYCDRLSKISLQQVMWSKFNFALITLLAVKLTFKNLLLQWPLGKIIISFDLQDGVGDGVVVGVTEVDGIGAPVATIIIYSTQWWPKNSFT